MHFCFLSCVRAKTAVLKAALGKLLRDRRGAHVGFSERIDTMGQIGGVGGGGGGAIWCKRQALVYDILPTTTDCHS